MIRTVGTLFIAALALLAKPPEALASKPIAKSRPQGPAISCPSGEEAFTYKFDGKTHSACQPAAPGAYCAEGRYFLRSPATGQTACTAQQDATWFCPAGERPKNFKGPDGRIAAVCEPSRAGAFCSTGRFLVQSPGTGQTSCEHPRNATWACPSGEQLKNYKGPNGTVELACMPGTGNRCAAGRSPTFNAAITANVCAASGRSARR
jgi:hypothetical protein